jgi:hypothetical protein
MPDMIETEVQKIAHKIAELGIGVEAPTMVFALALATASYLNVAFPMERRYGCAAVFFRDLVDMLDTLSGIKEE